VLSSKLLPAIISFCQIIITSYLSFHLSYNVQYYSLVKRAHLAGLLPFLFQIMVTPYIHDALCLRYGWQPSSCVCGKPITVHVEHAFSCPFGGFPSIRHNELWDITATLLSKVCSNVRRKPSLQPLSGEQFHYRPANVKDGARLDGSAESFWGRDKKVSYFDVKV